MLFPSLQGQRGAKILTVWFLALVLYFLIVIQVGKAAELPNDVQLKIDSYCTGLVDTALQNSIPGLPASITASFTGPIRQRSIQTCINRETWWAKRMHAAEEKLNVLGCYTKGTSAEDSWKPVMEGFMTGGDFHE